MDVSPPGTLCGGVLDARRPVLGGPRQFHPVRAVCGPKRKISRRENFLRRSRRNQYFILKYGPQHAFWCDIGKIWDDSFWENALFCIPYFGPKWPFLASRPQFWPKNESKSKTDNINYWRPLNWLPIQPDTPTFTLPERSFALRPHM